jgi:16S rRNA (guanine527-N7)-methyltransferase
VSSFAERLAVVFEKNGFMLSAEQKEKFEIYRNFLLYWNEKVNLTAISSDEGIIIKHFLDSAFAAKYVPLSKRQKLADIGSGAGFPSVPLKIMYPGLDITLVDSLNKRIVFLQSLLDTLGLKGKALHIRAEDAAQSPLYREKFDLVSARAVARMNILCEYCLPFVMPGGLFIALKGFEIEAELEEARSAVKTLGGQFEALEKFQLSESEKRSIILIKKISQTSSKYPRQSGKILKNPLL